MRIVSRVSETPSDEHKLDAYSDIKILRSWNRGHRVLFGLSLSGEGYT